MNTHFRVHVEMNDIGEIRPMLGIPPKKAAEIMSSDEAAINFARACLTHYERHPTEKGAYYRFMNDMKFYVNFLEKDKALVNIIEDFLLHGTYEPQTTALVRKWVKPGMICLDVGASIGYFTLLFAKIVGVNGKVYSIEPTSNQHRYLMESIEANHFTNIEAHNIGAWGSETDIHLKMNLGNEQVVHVKPLDSIFVANEPVDFVKIDTDGAEPEVLKGLEETIKRSPHMKMVIEYYPQYIKNLGLNPRDMMDFLDKYFTYEQILGDYGDGYWNYFCTRKVD